MKRSEKADVLDVRRMDSLAMGRAVVANVRREKCEVYCGRRHPQFPGEDGYFGNPIDGAASMSDYIAYFVKRLDEDDIFRARVKDLRGHVLGCWCYPRPCHAMVLSCYANLDAEDQQQVLDIYHRHDAGSGKNPDDWESVIALTQWAREDRGA